MNLPYTELGRHASKHGRVLAAAGDCCRRGRCWVTLSLVLAIVPFISERDCMFVTVRAPDSLCKCSFSRVVGQCRRDGGGLQQPVELRPRARRLRLVPQARSHDAIGTRVRHSEPLQLIEVKLALRRIQDTAAAADGMRLRSGALPYWAVLEWLLDRLCTLVTLPLFLPVLVLVLVHG